AGRARGEQRRAALLTWSRTPDPKWTRLNQRVEDHQQAAPKPQVVKALISSEGVPAVRTHTQGGDFLEHTHFLKRGDPNQKGDVATQSFIQVLTRSPDGGERGQVAHRHAGSALY